VSNVRTALARVTGILPWCRPVHLRRHILSSMRYKHLEIIRIHVNCAHAREYRIIGAHGVMWQTTVPARHFYDEHLTFPLVGAMLVQTRVVDWTVDSNYLMSDIVRWAGRSKWEEVPAGLF
jgi:hypothetical protein